MQATETRPVPPECSAGDLLQALDAQLNGQKGGRLLRALNARLDQAGPGPGRRGLAGLLGAASAVLVLDSLLPGSLPPGSAALPHCIFWLAALAGVGLPAIWTAGRPGLPAEWQDGAAALTATLCILATAAGALDAGAAGFVVGQLGVGALLAGLGVLPGLRFTAMRLAVPAGLCGVAAAEWVSGLPMALVAVALAYQIVLGVIGLAASRQAGLLQRRTALLELREVLRQEAAEHQERAQIEMSHTDPLTGAANRRMFESELDLLCQGDPGASLAVVLVDLDDFRRFNERYGRHAGDRCLAALAAIMQQQLRTDIDLLARYSGEEFAVLLPGADLGDTGLVAERMRRAVEDLAIPHETSRVRGVMTVSVGFAAAERGRTNAEALVDAAEMALMSAKHAGGNRIVPPLAVSRDRGLKALS